MFDKTKEELVKELRDYACDMMEKKDCTNRYRLPQITVELACLGCYFEHPGTWKDLTDNEKTNWGHVVDVDGLSEFAKSEVKRVGKCDDYMELAWRCMEYVSAKRI